LQQDQNTAIETDETAGEPPCEESDTPVFLRDSSEGQKCDPQDEKDKTEE